MLSLLSQMPALGALGPAVQYLSDPAEAQRWSDTSRCWRLLYGCWESDLESRTTKVIGSVRREAWGQVDLSANLYRVIWDAVSTLYDRPPRIEHDDPAGLELAELVAASGYWQLMQRVQRDTLGLREMLVRLDAVPRRDGQGYELTHRAVTPDVVVAQADPDRPDVPVVICEARVRGGDWVWDELAIDLADGAPSYQQRQARGGEVVNLGSGESYPYRDSAGVPELPYVLYHAQRTGRLWDVSSTLELVEGTLNLGVYYSLFGHVLRSASWPQRWAIDLMVGGAAPLSTDGQVQTSVVTDPGTVALFYSSPQAQGQPQIGQWQTSADPMLMIESIGAYERRLVTYAGINAADQIRMAGDPRSGYAVAVSRDAQREVQRRFEPQFRAGDEQALRLAAILLNRASGTNRYPESGYRVAYEGVPYSADEVRGKLDRIRELRDAGLMSRVQAYQDLHPGVSESDARKALAQIDAESGEASASPFANVGLPALVEAGIIGASAARKMLGVDEASAPTEDELVALGKLPAETPDVEPAPESTPADDAEDAEENQED
jgi:hypothetical protein